MSAVRAADMSFGAAKFGGKKTALKGMCGDAARSSNMPFRTAKTWTSCA
ncbi:hypothetical protein [Nannocystis pusilla]|uniref:Uncharacterized protein n=1 Tax=Nannocystis pusilla TaxID=889268 RepID=A0ABS7U4Y9_9BACT|nr:hypothetical protein [Nannocystis pusilla]MBZ5715397.1 hypothetical protein [Nannocystis pusilla]